MSSSLFFIDAALVQGSLLAAWTTTAVLDSHLQSDPIQIHFYIVPTVVSPEYNSDYANPHYSFSGPQSYEDWSPNFLR